MLTLARNDVLTPFILTPLGTWILLADIFIQKSSFSDIFEQNLTFLIHIFFTILTKILRMESGFEEPIRSFSRTPRKMSRDNGQFRTRTHSIASTGSNGETNGVKSVKVSTVECH